MHLHRLLIDECLSPDLAAEASKRGHEAAHVVRLGHASAPDWRVARLALERDAAVVTNNGRDFRRLLGRAEVHGGLVVILPNVSIPRQRELFARVLAHLETLPDLVNLLVAIDAEGRITEEPLGGAVA